MQELFSLEFSTRLSKFFCLFFTVKAQSILNVHLLFIFATEWESFHWAGGWPVFVHSAVQIGHSPLSSMGKSNGNRLPVHFHPMDRWKIRPPSICFWWTGSERMTVGVSGHVCADTLRSINDNAVFDQVHLKNWQADLIVQPMWKYAKGERIP